MNKILAGLVFGLILGAIDGATAWFYPETRSVIGGIMVGSSIKGMLVGLLAGWFAYKVQSTLWGIVVGSVLGLLFAYAPTMPFGSVRPVRSSPAAWLTTRWR